MRTKQDQPQGSVGWMGNEWLYLERRLSDFRIWEVKQPIDDKVIVVSPVGNLMSMTRKYSRYGISC